MINLRLGQKEKFPARRSTLDCLVFPAHLEMFDRAQAARIGPVQQAPQLL